MIKFIYAHDLAAVGVEDLLDRRAQDDMALFLAMIPERFQQRREAARIDGHVVFPGELGQLDPIPDADSIGGESGDRRTFDRWIRDGRLTPVRVGRVVLVPTAEINRLLRDHAVCRGPEG